ncbi:large subunit GTPase 1 homolog isoform X1 [Hydractinia symbiolongicarpus]|uniref:large subunit GTPase 1 homolog isoform X1 n=1 Tax=Hydractinia symbiolongicarpus TaxID=13093 RepID=UPI00254DD6A5|nr:large subunit GTPase 1 homolog isoform X1 [Hydractinia symbiolongicarpus]
MGKNKKSNTKHPDLGRSLIKGKNQAKRSVQRAGKDSWLHTSEVQDGYDWNRLNLQSITEQNTLDEFLETAELAGVEFTAEKLNVKIVGTGSVTGVLGDAEKESVKKLQEENRSFVTIPRRPKWDVNTSSEELALLEREAFLTWRRTLALLQEEKQLLLTPYEKNLDVWRQLWRVIERSDVICQIVDARNPLLYKCDDLESYIKEVDPSKKFIILINKADYLTETQRSYWLNYFNTQRSKVIFWSALEEGMVDEETTDIQDRELSDEVKSLLLTQSINQDAISKEEDSRIDKNVKQHEEENTTAFIDSVVETTEDCECPKSDNISDNNNTELLSRKRLLDFFRSFEQTDAKNKKSYLTIGLVGYPNVGKSSTINALMQEKKTAVSATPGKTKHFQTLFIDDNLCLCDCPGLVFPTFVSTKAEMVLNGILPIDQLKDYIAPSTILAQMIPKKIIENTYGINIPKPKEGENPNRPPSAEEMLSSYGRMRGFMTNNGLPDCPRASRYILKDFIKGKLLYCHPPPDVSEDKYQPCTISQKFVDKMLMREEKESKRKDKNNEVDMNEVDKDFFSEKPPAAHFKAPTGSQHGPQLIIGNDVIQKPWKRHGNKNKREKLRRIYNNNN